jgi:hypothetical protein
MPFNGMGARGTLHKHWTAQNNCHLPLNPAVWAAYTHHTSEAPSAAAHTNGETVHNIWCCAEHVSYIR